MSDEDLNTEAAILNDIGEGSTDNDTITGADDVESTIENTATSEEEIGVSTEGVQQTGSSATGNGDSSTVDQSKQGVGPQDLVDGQGNVIAKAGAERRHYENLQRTRTELDSIKKENATLKAQNEAFNQVNTIGKELGISNEEVISGARIIAAYKTDPVGTLEHMLTQAKAAGYNVDALSGGQVDMAAMQQIINQAMSPITEQAEQTRIAKENEEQALQEYNSFMGRFPDAAVHQDTLARLLKEQPDLSLDAAYYKLQSFYNARGFDWTKPLSQIEQEQQAQTQAQEQTRPVPPSGSGGLNNADLTDATLPTMGANVQFDDIIRESMKEAGLN